MQYYSSKDIFFQKKKTAGQYRDFLEKIIKIMTRKFGRKAKK